MWTQVMMTLALEQLIRVTLEPLEADTQII
jgi:hypothetical protein